MVKPGQTKGAKMLSLRGLNSRSSATKCANHGGTLGGGFGRSVEPQPLNPADDRSLAHA